MGRAADFLAGALVGLALGCALPAAAAEAYLKCEPTIRQSWSEACAHDNALQTHFNHNGQVPNRCKIS